MSISLYDLVKEAQENIQAMQKLIDLFEPKLKKTLFLTRYEEREDLSQELKYTLIRYILRYNPDSVPGFWELKKSIENQMNELHNS
ncbi:helix-turn-helix domain-containing protein [Gracilibacillus sp. S3-1-1]|uniref:Helix-turn-helix domain-containing protein n=1 Tax=Gracilibacillus pellucidus TaxID=3095368 RepID=A0ACC6M6F5_9BACI|nr:helix-turn-helix domain-containing protein [Gracilibacillus sp. S3-1-1]MDX8046529.1 helix-turn-helix domain-containing protein [Gracilibacillus sp. S3-1-1]